VVTVAVAVTAVSAAVVAWVYAGYPAMLAVLARVRPRPRARAAMALPVTVVIAAHNEAPIIAAKVANVRASDYPAGLLEIVVASDGSTDDTVAVARAAGADTVLDLPRVGKLRALNAAVAKSSGDVLVFTDADARLEPATVGALVANFADDTVGAVAANEVHVVEHEGVPVARGERLYWRYEQAIKRLEDRVGSAVSASGRLYALRHELFVPSSATASTDDFVISTQAIRAGRRLAFDEHARVLVETPEDGGTELRRKVRVMNRGLRGALALAGALRPFERPGYLLQLVCHKILRRFVGFFLLALLVASGFLAVDDARWWLVLGPQLAWYLAAVAGALIHARHRRPPKPAWVAYYFVLSNLAAALAVCSLAHGSRYEVWEPSLARAPATEPEVVT
jgi:cellulose synthase/poly-beta-1,6-N-acetylglucosamine synthase-like glycosyltransferase